MGCKAMRITGQAVIIAVSEYFGVSVEDLKGSAQVRPIARPRQVAMYLCRQYCTHLSYPAVGRMLGGRDHTTILHGVKNIARLIAIDPDFETDISNIVSGLANTPRVAMDIMLTARIHAAEAHLDTLLIQRADQLARPA